jgi:WD40 repeat protein
MGLGDDRFSVEALGFDGTSERLGTLPFDLRLAARCADATNSRWFEVSKGQGVYVIEFGDHGLSAPRRIEPLEGPIVGVECDPLGRFVAAHYEDGQIRLWEPDGESPPRVIQGSSGITELRITTDGSFLAAIKREQGEFEIWIWSLESEEPALLRHIDLGKSSGELRQTWTLNTVQRQLVTVPREAPGVRLWPLQAPADAEPVIMQRGDLGSSRSMEIHPSGGWLADADTAGLTLWPVARPYPIVIKRYEKVSDLAFGPDGRWLATSSSNLSGTVRMWRLEGDALPPARIVHEARIFAYGIAASPDGKQILLGTHDKGVQLLSLDGGPPRTLPGVTQVVFGVAFSPDGRFAAAAGNTEKISSSVIRVWELSSHEEVNVFDLGDAGANFIQFTEGGNLLSGGRAGLLRWNLETGDSDLLYEGITAAVTADGRRALLLTKASTSDGTRRALLFVDLETGAETPLESHGDRVYSAALDAAGKIVATGDLDGIVRVGPVTGEEAHMLLGHSGAVVNVAFDPRGRWIASSAGTEVRLWPMPDLSKPPLHTLPREELIAKLKTLTNLRVVRDEESATGWKLTHDPFPGWETVPTW